MSIAEELTIHDAEHYADFHDGQHNIAVFGLGYNALLTEAQLEGVAVAVAADAQTPQATDQQPVSLSV